VGGWVSEWVGVGMYELFVKHEFHHEKLIFNKTKTKSLNTLSWPKWLIADFTPLGGGGASSGAGQVW